MAIASAESSLPQRKTVLLLVDFINPLDFPGAEDLAASAVEAARATAALKNMLRDSGVPAIYANDNYGLWKSDFKDLVKRFQGGSGPARELTRIIKPAAKDLTVLKPRHSAFHGSPLNLMLEQMGAEEIILTGVATDICIQLTAMDAFLRGYRVRVPSDCTAAESTEFKTQSLAYMARVLECDTSPSSFFTPYRKARGARTGSTHPQ